MDKMPDEMEKGALWSDGKEEWEFTGYDPTTGEADDIIYNLLEDIKCLEEDAQKHAEEIAALRAEHRALQEVHSDSLKFINFLQSQHRAEMAGLCDEIESTLTGIRGIDSYCSGWNGCSNEVRRNLKLIKQRISDE